ncbi:Crp/Fnr family transcriptional regulator [Methylobacterium radiotolerans]|uniref:Cyclic nucleotide-binding protein n=1 Tax=Methylobacterium radiotolerans (strain ATCC 27329 / DSM 1819 / JCM 2831 / NBRC 15690 / NCIMB 10815 / 0-1) TaxID=426355 RepID=B1M9A7_METRJ|nr:Crp/Fnr family transcriptional regulator [Methylobacterium radiotolerans]ACB28082.1 cyclic nucleotide-binding protein [Methylobacterium radiotolerans JCM 2831]GEN00993.1 hypothetical protein MRA01_55320 [Methylobacterium radiotolerans]
MSDQTPADEPGAAFGGVRLAEKAYSTGAPSGLLERLSPADRERVSRHGGLRSFERGATLLAQGAPHDGIMIIETGLVRSFYTAPTGREITLAYWSPGNFIGGPEIFGGGTHIWSAVAAKRSTVTVLPGRGLRALAREVPDLALAIIDALVFKAKCYASLAQMLGTRSLTERLGQLLTHLAATYGLPPEADGSVTVAAAFTHAEIANLIGGTRQWVTISLNRLQTEGVLTQRKGLLVIRKPDRLTTFGLDAG